MASRIRTVKPELFRHEALFEAEQETGLPLRLAFIGLFTVSDRNGVFRWKPRQLKLDVMPYDSHDFSRVLDALMTRGFVCHYACEGDEYGVIPSFTRHQVINNREKHSGYPQIEDAEHVFSNEINEVGAKEARVLDASSTRHGNVQGEGKGREGEQEGKGKGKARVVDAWLASLVDLGVNEQHAKDWLAVRKGKGAKMSDSVMQATQREAKKANVTLAYAIQVCAERGWQGFRAEYLANKPGGFVGGQQFPTKAERIEAANNAVLQEILAEEAAKGHIRGGVIDDAPSFAPDGDFIEGEFFHGG